MCLICTAHLPYCTAHPTLQTSVIALFSQFKEVESNECHHIACLKYCSLLVQDLHVSLQSPCTAVGPIVLVENSDSQDHWVPNGTQKFVLIKPCIILRGAS